MQQHHLNLHTATQPNSHHAPIPAAALLFEAKQLPSYLEIIILIGDGWCIWDE